MHTSSLYYYYNYNYKPYHAYIYILQQASKQAIIILSY